MYRYALLLNPGHNRVYYKSSQQLSAVEFAIMAQTMDCTPSDIQGKPIAGIYYLTFSARTALSERDLDHISHLSFLFALYQLEGELLRPVLIPQADLTGVSVSSLLKYTGKTNELFTRMMLNVALSSCTVQGSDPIRILDPIAGKGTTLFEGLALGCDCYGIEIGEKAASEGYHCLKKYLELQRIKHKPLAQKLTGPNKSFTAKRFLIDFAEDRDTFREKGGQHWELVAGNSAWADRFFRKNYFHGLVGDLPYGVQHGSVTGDRSGRARSPKELVRACLPAWRTVLKPGGVLVLAWNVNVFPKDQFEQLLREGGLEVLREGPYDQFAHRVDNAILRDIMVARKPN